MSANKMKCEEAHGFSVEVLLENRSHPEISNAIAISQLIVTVEMIFRFSNKKRTVV